MVTNLPASARDVRDVGSIPGREDPLAEEMEIHSSILAWRTHGQRAIVHRVAESDTTEGT